MCPRRAHRQQPPRGVRTAFAGEPWNSPPLTLMLPWPGPRGSGRIIRRGTADDGRQDAATGRRWHQARSTTLCRPVGLRVRSSPHRAISTDDHFGPYGVRLVGWGPHASSRLDTEGMRAWRIEMNCTHCRRPLRNVQWREAEKWKSCPHCSTLHGSEHVFYPYPDAFGTTPARATQHHPEGPQSYCTPCRAGESGDLQKSRACSDFP